MVRVSLISLTFLICTLGLTAGADDPEPRMQGEVAWFSPIKGYGIITPRPEADREKSVFIHISELARAGMETLEDGQCVEFDPYRLEKGDIIALKPSEC